MSTDRPEESFAALFESSGRAVPSRRGPRLGERFDVVVVQVGREAIFVEFDGRRQGYIDALDFRAADGTTKATVGATVRARVVDVDAERGVRLAPTVEAAAAVGATVSLGTAEEPAAVRIAVGDVIGCTVDRVELYGLFVQVDGTRARAGRGLLPLVELGVPRGTDLRKAFAIGTKMKAKVLAIGEGKLRLSLRALKDDEERSQFDAFQKKDKVDVPQGLGTFGDLLKKRGK
jgi:small subunit ribosomal protein S1